MFFCDHYNSGKQCPKFQEVMILQQKETEKQFDARKKAQVMILQQNENGWETF